MNNKTKKTKKVIVVKWEHILKNVKSFLKKRKKKTLRQRNVHNKSTTGHEEDCASDWWRGKIKEVVMTGWESRVGKEKDE